MSTDKRENVTFAERKEKFERQVQTAQTIAISGHMNPDGDCIGSCLGLYTYIVEQYPEKEVTLFLEPVQDKFSRLTDRMTCFFLLTVPIQIVSMISKVILKRQNTRYA